ncbi:MAG: hypothetical protein H7843_06255 [Nitrospirota bacterium]
MKHFAGASFWTCYEGLPAHVRKLADKNFSLLKENPHHPSIHLKQVDKHWSIRIGKKHRALAVEINEGLLWYWIGTHAEYDRLIR